MPEPFDRLDHVVVAVRDLDAAAASHARLLGRPAAWYGVHPALGTRNALFRLENTYLELLAPAEKTGLGRVLAQRLESEGEGLLALAFGTADAPACAKTLAARGLPAEALEEEQGVERDSGAVRCWRRVTLSAEHTRGVALFGVEHRSAADAWPEPGPADAPAACVAALDHVVVRSADLDAALEFYRDRLGLRLALDRSFPERGMRILFFRVGGATLEVAGSPDAGSGADRLWGLAWRVADVAAAAARLKDAGVDVSAVRRGVKPGTQVCTVRSETHGVATLLIGPLASQEADSS